MSNICFLLSNILLLSIIILNCQYMNKYSGFTLVELVVCVTIIILLWSIWVIGFTNYSQWVRDSWKIAQLSMINKALSQKQVSSQIPKPDNFIRIMQNDKILWYQGDIWIKTLKAIWVAQWDILNDPENNFFYVHTNNKKYFQVWTLITNQKPDDDFLEITQVAAKNNQQAYFLGKQIGTFFDDQNLPLHTNTTFSQKDLDLNNLSQEITLQLTDINYVRGMSDSFSRYEELLQQWGKWCSTNGENINCMTYDDEREQWSGIGYVFVDWGNWSTTPGTPDPDDGMITLDPVSYPSDLADLFQPDSDFTQNWSNRLNNCKINSMDIVQYYPWDNIDTYISTSQSNTIFVFNEWNYTLNKPINTSKWAHCIWFIGVWNPQIGLSQNSNDKSTTIQARWKNILVIWLTFNGSSDGTNELVNKTHRGVYMRDVSNFTISHVNAFNHEYDGIRVYGNYGSILNTTTHNNQEEWIQIWRSTSNQDARFIYIKNIVSYKNGNNWIALINWDYIGATNIETFDNQISGVSLETISRGYISSIWSHNNQHHGIQVWNNLDVDNIFIDNIVAYNNLSAGIYIDSTVNRANINNVTTFSNLQTGIWTAWDDIAINNSNIFNNNYYGLSIATQAYGTLLHNIQFYKNQYGALVAQWYNSRSAWYLYSTNSSCSYCEYIDNNNVEQQKYVQISDVNWDYQTIGKIDLTNPRDLQINYGSSMNLQRQPYEYYWWNSRPYGQNTVQYFNTNDVIWEFQDVITQIDVN